MAIKKNIELDNGITLTYHRIVRIQSIINFDSMIEVQSYMSKQNRLREKGNPSNVDIYTEASYYHIPYDPELNVTKAYEYIKSLPEFEGAEDVLEEDIPGIDTNATGTPTGDDSTTASGTN